MDCVSTQHFDDPAVQLAHDSALKSIARVVHETVTPTPPAQALAFILRQLRATGCLVLTGAGVSTDSGIPDYRGPNGSLTRHRPMTYQEFQHDPEALRRYWARSFIGWRHMDEARPNSVHRAIAALEARGFVAGLITQNVDGLHMQAGSRTVIPLHGDLGTVCCLTCGHREKRTRFDKRLASANPGYVESIHVDTSMVNPDGDVALRDEDVAAFHLAECENCGSTKLKPDVVYFGEPVPANRKARARELLDTSSSLLVVGSSLAVMSGYTFVLDARAQGKPVAVINGGPGRGDKKADVVWRTDVASAFEQISAALDVA